MIADKINDLVYHGAQGRARASKIYLLYKFKIVQIFYLILLILHYICHHSCSKIKTQLGLDMISGQITHPLEKLLKQSFILSFAVDDTR